MKKLYSLVVASLIATASFAQSGTTGNLSWNITNGTLTISGTGAMPDYPPMGSPWFSYKDNITSVVVGTGVESIGDFAFTILYRVTSVTIPDGVASIGSDAFGACLALTSINLPNSVTSIGNSAFNGCSFTSIIIPDGVQTIGDFAFNSCIALGSITIPNSVTSIGAAAFNSCSNLNNIYIECTTPPTAYDFISTDVPISCVLHVPAGLESTYRSAPGWGGFANITGGTTGLATAQTSQFVISVRDRNIVVENATAPVSVYDISGRCVGSSKGEKSFAPTQPTTIVIPQAGMYIVHVGNATQKVVVR